MDGLYRWREPSVTYWLLSYTAMVRKLLCRQRTAGRPGWHFMHTKTNMHAQNVNKRRTSLRVMKRAANTASESIGRSKQSLPCTKWMGRNKCLIFGECSLSGSSTVPSQWLNQAFLCVTLMAISFKQNLLYRHLRAHPTKAAKRKLPLPSSVAKEICVTSRREFIISSIKTKQKTESTGNSSFLQLRREHAVAAKRL